MTLVYYPNPVFKQKAQIVTLFDDTLKNNVEILKQAMQDHRAIGIGANMCGILQRIIIVPKDEESLEKNDNLVMINPEITEKSDETQTAIESSLSLPGIEAHVTRPARLTVHYQDINGEKHTLTVNGFLATVIQHEMDYLDGIVYLDHLPKAKARLLREKMQKYLKKIERHGHTSSHVHYHNGKACSHQH